MNYRVLGNDGGVYDVPEENLGQALSQGELYDARSSFNLVNPETQQTAVAPKSDLGQYFRSGYQLNLSRREPIRMVDPVSLEMFDVPFENLGSALQMGGTIAKRGKMPADPKLDSTGEGYALSGEKNWWDSVRDMKENPMSYIPFLNAVDIFDSFKLYSAANAVKDGYASPEQKNLVTRHTADAQRGQTWGSKVADIITRLPAFAVEFAVGGAAIKGAAKKAVTSATRAAIKPTAKAAVASLARDYGAGDLAEDAFSTVDDVVEAIVKNTGKSTAVVKKNLTGELLDLGYIESKSLSPVARSLAWMSEPAEETVGKIGAAAIAMGKKPGVTGGDVASKYGSAMLSAAAEQSKRALGTAALRTTLLPHRGINSSIINMTPVFGLTPDQRGNAELVLVDEGDGFVKAFAKGFGDMMIENFSETTGANFVFLRATAGKAAKDYVKASTLALTMDRMATEVAKKIPGSVTDAMKTARKTVAEFVLGSSGKAGLLQKAGWNGYFAELGEEVVGGALRQALGINPVGLPSLEDVSAMAVGFLVNPLAIAASGHSAAVNSAARKRDEFLAARDESVKIQAETGVPVVAAKESKIYTATKEAIETRAKAPEGVFGSFMHKVFQAPIEKAETQALGDVLVEGLAPGSTKDSRTPEVAILDKFIESAAQRLRRSGSSEALDEEVVSILSYFGHNVALPGQEGGLTKLREAVKAGGADFNTSIRGAVFMSLKDGKTLSDKDYQNVRAAIPYLRSEIDLDRMFQDGKTVEEMQAEVFANPSLYSFTAEDGINSELDLVWKMRHAGVRPIEYGTKDMETYVSDLRSLASILGMTAEVRGAGQNPAEFIRRTKLRLEPLAASIRQITSTYGLPVDVVAGKVIVGSQSLRDKVLAKEQEAYGRVTTKEDAPAEIKGPRVRSFTHGARTPGRIMLSLESMLSGHGLPALVEELTHELTMNKNSLTDGLQGVIDRLKGDISMAKKSGQPDKAEPAAALTNLKPEELLAHALRAQLGVNSALLTPDMMGTMDPIDIALTMLAPELKLSRDEMFEIGQAIVLSGKAGVGINPADTIEMQSEKAIRNFLDVVKIATQNVANLDADEVLKKEEKVASKETTGTGVPSTTTPKAEPKTKSIPRKTRTPKRSSNVGEEDVEVVEESAEAGDVVEIGDDDIVEESDDTPTSSSVATPEPLGPESRKALRDFMKVTDNRSVNLDDLTLAQQARIAEIIQSEPKMLADRKVGENAVEQDKLAAQMRRYIVLNSQDDARRAGFHLPESETEDLFEQSEDGMFDDAESGLAFEDEAFGRSLLAKLIALFPEGRDRERDIVDFFGFNKNFRLSLKREKLNSEEAWAEYMRQDVLWGKDIFTRDLRHQTADMLEKGDLTLDQLYALASLESVRYVAPQMLVVDSDGVSFKQVAGSDVMKLRRKAGRALGKVTSEEGLKKLLSDLDKVIVAYDSTEEEKKLNKEYSYASKLSKEAAWKAHLASAQSSAFEKNAVSFLLNYLGVDPVITLSGMFYGKNETGIHLHRKNIVTMLKELRASVSAGLEAGQTATRITADALSLFSKERGRIPSFAYQFVSSGNRSTVLLSDEQKAQLLDRVAVPERYRNTTGKLENSATRRSNALRVLDSLRKRYYFVSGALAAHEGSNQGYDKKQITSQELLRAEKSSWMSAVKTGGSYMLVLGPTASKEKSILIETETPVGATFADKVRWVLNSPSARYALEQGKGLLELGVPATEWFPSLKALTELSTGAENLDALFKFQEALDRAYYRGKIIDTPVQLVKRALKKMKKAKAETPEDVLALREEYINENKRSSSMVTPQVSPTIGLPGGLGKTMKVLLLQDPTFNSVMFPGDKGDRTDGWALWTADGLRKLQVAMGSTLTSSISKGLHTSPGILYKESEAGLQELADGWIAELGDRASEHPLVKLAEMVNAMPIEQRPDIVRFTSSTKLGGGEKAKRDIWDYDTRNNTVKLKADFAVDASDVFDVSTEDFGLVGKADKDITPVRDTIPTQWLPSNLGTSEVMSSEFTEFMRQVFLRNFDPKRIESMERQLKSRNPEDLLKLIGPAEFLPSISSKLKAGVTLNASELRQLAMFIGNRIADELGKIKVNRGSSVNTPSVSTSLDGTSPEVRVSRSEGGTFHLDPHGTLVRASGVRANILHARVSKKMSELFPSETEALKGAVREIFRQIAHHRDFLTIYTAGKETVSFDEAFQRAAQKLVDEGRKLSIDSKLLERVSSSLSRRRAPKGADMGKLVLALPAQNVIDAVAEHIELHEIVTDYEDGQFSAVIRGSPILFIRVPSPGSSSIGYARLEGNIGNKNTNQMIMHPDDSSRAGADFDIDAWYHFGPEGQQRIGEIGDNFMSSWIVRLMQGALRDVKGHSERYTKTDPQAYKELAQSELKKFLKGLSDPYYSWEVQGQLREANLAVKKVVGIFAASVRLINALRVRGLKLKSVPGATNLDRFEMKMEDGTTFVLGHVTEISPAAVSHFNTMLQMAVDNDKLLYLPALGITETNAGFITAMFLFNPDLMRGNASKADFQKYLQKVLQYVKNNPAAVYEFEEKKEKKTASYFARRGRENIRSPKDLLFKSPGWKQFKILKHFANTLFTLGQVQNITTKPPKSFFNHIERVNRLESLLDPNGFSESIKKVGVVSMDTRASMLEEGGQVSPLFGHPVRMNELYRSIQFQNDPVASRASEEMVQGIFEGVSLANMVSSAMDYESAPDYAASEAEQELKDKSIKYNVAFQKRVADLVMSVFMAEAANTKNETLTSDPSADAEAKHLNTRLIKRTNELKEEFPENLFLQAIDAQDERGVGPVLVSTLAKNVDPSNTGFEEIRADAEKLPKEYLQDMLVYARLRWGDATRMFSGNIDSALPMSVQSDFAEKTITTLEWWNAAGGMGRFLAEKYYKWFVDAAAGRGEKPFFVDGSAPVKRDGDVELERPVQKEEAPVYAPFSATTRTEEAVARGIVATEEERAWFKSEAERNQAESDRLLQQFDETSVQEDFDAGQAAGYLAQLYNEALKAKPSESDELSVTASSVASNEDEINIIARSMERAKRLKGHVKVNAALPGDMFSFASSEGMAFKKFGDQWYMTDIDYGQGAEATLRSMPGYDDGLKGVPVSEAKVYTLWLQDAEELGVGETAHYANVAKAIEAWKKEEGIVYNPAEAWRRGEAFYHDIGAFNPSAPGLLGEIGRVLLAQSRLLRKGDTKWWEKTKDQLLVSGYTLPPNHKAIPFALDGGIFESDGKFGLNVDYGSDVTIDGGFDTEWFNSLAEAQAYEKLIKTTAPVNRSRRPGSGLRFVIRPASSDIVWAAAHDVYSGTVRNAAVNVHPFPATSRNPDGSYQWAVFNPDGTIHDEGTAGSEEKALSMGEARIKELSREIRAVDPKAPSAQNLQSIADSIEAAIRGRTKYNEIGVRLRLGNFYIEGARAEVRPMQTPEGVRWAIYSNGIPTGNHFVHRASAEAASKDMFSLPSELQRLNTLLKRAYRVANGSLDAIPAVPTQSSSTVASATAALGLAATLGLGSIQTEAGQVADQVAGQVQQRADVTAQDMVDWAQRTRDVEKFYAMRYLDSTTNWTVGFGFNMTDRNSVREKIRFKSLTGKDWNDVWGERAGLTEQEANRLLEADLKDHYQAAANNYANAAVPFAQWPVSVKMAVADMTFMGALPQFPAAHAALLAGNFQTAAKELLDNRTISRWLAARPNRSIDSATTDGAPTIVRYREAAKAIRDYVPKSEPISYSSTSPKALSESKLIIELGPNFDNWPIDSDMKSRRELTSKEFERAAGKPFKLLVLNAFRTLENPEEPYFSRATAAKLKEFASMYSNSGTRPTAHEALVRVLNQTYGIPLDMAEQVANSANLPLDGSNGPREMPYHTTTLSIDEAFRNAFLSDEETRRRRREDRNGYVESSVVVNEAVTAYGKQFTVYNRSWDIMNRVRMFNERAGRYIHQTEEYFGTTGGRMRHLGDHEIYSVDPSTGELAVDKVVKGIDIPLGGRFTRSAEVKGDKGLITDQDRTDKKKWEWIQGALGTHQFTVQESEDSSALRFTVADMIVAFYKHKSGADVFTTGAKHIRIKKIVNARGTAVWSKLSPERRQTLTRAAGSESLARSAVGYNLFIEEAIEKARILTGGKDPVWDPLTEKYDLEGQTVALSDWYNDWKNSEMGKDGGKLISAGRSKQMLRLETNGPKGFRNLFWIEKQLILFQEESDQMNAMFEEVTGYPMFYQRFGYLMPQVAGGGWMTAQQSDWIERRTVEIREFARNALPFIDRDFGVGRYDTIPEDMDRLVPTEAQKKWFKDIQEYLVADLRNAKESLESAVRGKDKAEIKSAAERLARAMGMGSRGVNDPDFLIARADSVIEKRTSFSTKVQTFMDADGAIHTALLRKMYSEVKEKPVGPFRKVLSTDEEGLLDHLQKTITTHPAFRESSNRTKRRSYETWERRYEETGDLPASLSPFEMLDRYASDMHTILQSRAILSNAVTTMDMDGRPAAFISVVKNFDPDSKDTLIPRATLIRMVANMGQYLFREDGTRDFLFSPTKPLTEQIRAIADYLNRHSDLKVKKGPGGYEEMGRKTFNSIERIFADIGENAAMLRKIATMPYEIPYTFNNRRHDVLRGLRDFTITQKMARVSLSLFFPLAAVESQVGYYGQFKEFYRNPYSFIFGSGFVRGDALFMSLKTMKNALFNGHDPAFNHWLYEMTSAGLMVDITHDYDAPVKYFDNILERLETLIPRTKNKVVKGMAKGVDSLLKVQHNYTNWLFGSIFPLLKVHAAHLLSVRAEQTYRELHGKEWTPDEKRQTYAAIGRALNNGFGGQNWAQYAWASPKALQMLNLTMFAPNWTLSTANTMGAGILLNKMGLGPEVGSFEKKQMLIANTLIFSGALVLWPNILQAVIYAATRVFGDPDDEDKKKDKPFTFQNEEGRKLHVDVTPMLRGLPWFDGAPTGSRRFYARWGKQIYEVVDGWLVDPASTFMRKTSMPVQMVWSQLTGESPGSDFSLPFKDQGLVGWVTTPSAGFAGSRVANILSYNLPFSIPSLGANNFDAWALPLVTQVSKGKAAGTATRELERVFRTYAYNWNGVSQNPAARENLRALGIDIIDAVERNGYPTDKIINDAKGAVLKDLYVKMFEEMEANPTNPNMNEMDKWAKAILRVNGTIQGFHQHLKSKKQLYGVEVEMTPEMEEAIRVAFGN